VNLDRLDRALATCIVVLKCSILRKRKRRPVGRAQRLLGILGWSYGDLSYSRRDGHCVWQVYAQRDGDRIVARAWTQAAT